MKVRTDYDRGRRRMAAKIIRFARGQRREYLAKMGESSEMWNFGYTKQAEALDLLIEYVKMEAM